MLEITLQNTSKLRYAMEAPDGTEVRSYRLCGDHGQWLGDVTLEHSAKRHELRMMAISDYGNYGYRWNAIGDKGYARFLLCASNDYITDKMAHGHDEESVLYADETCDLIHNRLLETHKGDDADWIGESLRALDRCECELDFHAWADTYSFPDVRAYFKYGWGGWLNGFCSVLLPELKQVLKDELKEDTKEG